MAFYTGNASEQFAIGIITDGESCRNVECLAR